MTILKTGNKFIALDLRSNRRGITFIEVMVTLVILSVGLVALFKVFHASLAHLGHLTNRTYASNLLENRFARVQRMLTGYRTLPMEMDQEENISIGPRILTVEKNTSVGQIGNFVDIFRLDLTVSWKEGPKNITLKRSGVAADWSYSPE